jgi:hypothetical protein
MGTGRGGGGLSGQGPARGARQTHRVCARKWGGGVCVCLCVVWGGGEKQMRTWCDVRLSAPARTDCVCLLLHLRIPC